MTYWIVPIQEDMWDVILSRGIYGYKDDISNYVKEGDLLVIYVSKYYAKKYGGKIVGVVRTTSGWFKDDTPIYPEEVIRNRGIFVYRVKVEPIVVGVCDFKLIIDKVVFIEDKSQMAKYLRNAPANMKRPIPDGDGKIIEECLKEEKMENL